MSAIFIDLDRTGNWFVFTSPYNESFVCELKARVPAKLRRWAPEQKAWCVARDQWATTETLLRKHYGHGVVFEVGPAAEAAQIDLMVEEVSEPSAMDYMRIGVRADAPDCVVHAAFYALETLCATTSREETRRLGISTLDEIRAAYERVCALRGLHEAPNTGIRSVKRQPMLTQLSETRTTSLATSAPNLPLEDVPLPTDADYYGPEPGAYQPQLGFTTSVQPNSMPYIEFYEEGSD